MLRVHLSPSREAQAVSGAVQLLRGMRGLTHRSPDCYDTVEAWDSLAEAYPELPGLPEREAWDRFLLGLRETAVLPVTL